MSLSSGLSPYYLEVTLHKQDKLGEEGIFGNTGLVTVPRSHLLPFQIGNKWKEQPITAEGACIFRKQEYLNRKYDLSLEKKIVLVLLQEEKKHS